MGLWTVRHLDCSTHAGAIKMSTNPTPESTTLYLRNATSDKQYAASLEARGDGWVVQFQYGRRGAPQSCGSKTPAPVEYACAKKIYDGLIREKTGKGYTPAESGQAYQDTTHAGRDTGVRPQLLNAVPATGLDALLDDPHVIAQQKQDGVRRLLVVENGVAVGGNRKGLAVALPVTIANAATRACNGLGRTVIDGEDLGDCVVAFDLLMENGRDLTRYAYDTRLHALNALLGQHPEIATHLRCTTSARTPAEKRDLLATLRAKNAEGIVFKHALAPYEADRPDSGGPALKYKFVATATVRVGRCKPGKRSVAMHVRSAGVEVFVGHCTIPINAAIPLEGSLMDVATRTHTLRVVRLSSRSIRV
jgi:bifunctional non-homologous end joining protein LigD